MIMLLRNLIFGNKLPRSVSGLTDSRWQGATWAIVAGRAVNTPALGAEVLIDGGLENWTSPTNLTSWIETIAGASTVNQDGINQRSGAFCARLDFDAINSSARIHQNSLLLNRWHSGNIYAKIDVVAAGVGIYIFATGNAPISIDGNYKKITQTYRASSISFNVIRTGNSSLRSIYLDDASVMTIVDATLFRIIPFATPYFSTIKAAWTIGAGLQAGVVANLDSLANPQNYVIAYITPSGNSVLAKVVGGTYTALVNVATTYVADQVIEIRRPSGNTYSLWYNGVQRGTDQTISDAGIVNNRYHGLFSTNEGNSCGSFMFDGA